MIHIAIANEINKKIGRDSSKLLIGTIAPDISKLVGETKYKSHFSISEGSNIPDIDKFICKYKEYLNDDFVLGYYIHLYTDYLWFKYFIEDVDYSSMITDIDGSKIYCDKNTFVEYVYNDYTNINVSLIDKYNLDLKIFYNDVPNIKRIIDEVPMDKLNLIIDKAGEIVANSTTKKAFLFDVEQVINFINFSTKIILSNIEKM